jgi:1,2-dihydroxy-3-keto-5-methylthiopentene dioxygenase
MQSKLTVSPEGSPDQQEVFSDFEGIRKKLAEAKIGYERWEAEKPLAATATAEEVSEAYKSSIEKIMKTGYKTFDVVSLNPQSPNTAEARKKFIDEHTHGEDEVRFFVDGSGLFYIHSGGKVYMMLCTKGDYINLPAGTTHWFDMGPQPFFKAIRVFNNPEGWVATFTGSTISQQFPKYE